MPEATQVTYTHKELAAALLRDQGIDSGHWGVIIKFRFEGSNFATAPDVVTPGAITFIDAIGIQRFDRPTALTVDASTLSKPAPRRRARKAAKPAEKISANP